MQLATGPKSSDIATSAWMLIYYFIAIVPQSVAWNAKELEGFLVIPRYGAFRRWCCELFFILFGAKHDTRLC
jgi:hypothetical protein